MAKSMYDIIKKQNGEAFAQAIRKCDNGIFDVTDIDEIVKYAGRDAEPIMAYLLSLKEIKIQEHSVHMNPLKLLDMAGYDAYVANTLKKQNAIKKYYAKGEELCTFRDPYRFEEYFIINAVRKDVDEIKREDFENPRREDRYALSAISIQILKTGGFISIKNRYNHKVDNPDNTLNSNPDNIIPGLSDAIKHYFKVDFSSPEVTVPNGYTIINRQIIRHNGERNNVYFSENFFARDGKIILINKNSEIMLGNGLLLNLQKKQITDITFVEYSSFNPEDMRAEFEKSLEDAISDKKLQIVKSPLGGRDIIADGKQILTVENGEIVNINIPNAKTVQLVGNKKLRGELDFSGVEKLDLSGADLSRVTKLIMPKNATHINLSNAKLPACELDLSAVEDLELEGADLSRVTNLIMPKNATHINLSRAKLPACELDFSAVEVLDLSSVDLSHITKLTMPKNATHINLSNAKLPACEFDFSAVEVLDLSSADLSRVTKLTMPKNATRINLSKAKLRACELDFSGVEKLDLEGVDLSHITKLIMPKNAMLIRLSCAKLPACELDFSAVEQFYLYDTDLSHVTKLIMPKNAMLISLSYAKLPACELDLSAVKVLELNRSDLSHLTKLTMPKNATYINLPHVKLPACELDFSAVEFLNLVGADLSRVTKLIMPEHAEEVYLHRTKFPMFYKIHQGILKLQSRMAKIAKMFNPQEKDNDK